MAGTVAGFLLIPLLVLGGYSLLATSILPSLRRTTSIVAPLLLGATCLLVAIGLSASVGGDPLNAVQVGSPWVMVAAFVAGSVAGFVAFQLERRLSRALINRRASRTPVDALPASLRGTMPGVDESFIGVALIAQRPAVFAGITLWTATAEEVLYRGTVLLVCVPLGLDPWLALVLQATFYAGSHLAFGLPAVLGKILLGLSLGAVALVSGSILPALMVHIGYQILMWRQFRRWGKPRANVGEGARISP